MKSFKIFQETNVSKSQSQESKIFLKSKVSKNQKISEPQKDFQILRVSKNLLKSQVSEKNQNYPESRIKNLKVNNQNIRNQNFRNHKLLNREDKNFQIV